jgi:hypothetical protein
MFSVSSVVVVSPDHDTNRSPADGSAYSEIGLPGGYWVLVRDRPTVPRPTTLVFTAKPNVSKPAQVPFGNGTTPSPPCHET